jgi:predicted RNA-binding protein YlqC (UPF0109 family)
MRESVVQLPLPLSCAGGGMMKEFLEFVVKHLVDHPEGIVVEVEEKDNNHIFKLKVAEGDIGKIIGRHGQTATSLRVLLKAIAAKEGKRAVLDIIG